MAADAGNARMQEIAAAIQEGAGAYLRRQYTTIAIAGVVIFLIVAFLLGLTVAIGFLIGAVLSGAAGYIGMLVSVRANVRTAQAASQGLAEGLELAFRAGAVTGMLVAGLALLGVAVYYGILVGLAGYAPADRTVIDALVALGFGGSLISIFARLGGGIFTKGADVGGDLVGKVEAGIPEDDPRNPATIADNVGDNVGDCAGMAADLFETYAVTVVATMVLASIYFAGQDIVWTVMLFPLAICARLRADLDRRHLRGQALARRHHHGRALQGLHRHRRRSRSILLYPLTALVFPGGMSEPLTTNTGVSFTPNEPLLLRRRRPDRDDADHRHHRVLHRHQLPPGALDRPGLDHRPRHQRHPGPRRLARVDGAAGARHHRRHHRHLHARRPLRHRHRGHDDAGARRRRGRARRLRPGHRQRRRHRRDGRPAARRCAPPPTRSTRSATPPRRSPRATPSARRASARWCSSPPTPRTSPTSRRPPTEGSFFDGLNVDFSLSNPYVVVGLLFGGLLPYLFGGIAMTAVGRAAGSIVEEVRRQFRENPGIMAGTSKPDYGRAVDMLTKAAIREMIVPSLLPVLRRSSSSSSSTGSPAASAALAAVGAMLLGVIVNGLFVAISMTSGGGAWDNAKKIFEDGFTDADGQKHFKGSDAHKAAVTGDTVGDPYKDTAGPAVNPMIKITNIVALLMLAVLAH